MRLELHSWDETDGRDQDTGFWCRFWICTRCGAKLMQSVRVMTKPPVNILIDGLNCIEVIANDIHEA